MKRAVLVGIDRYDVLPSLTSACNDVAALRPLLEYNENSKNFHCREYCAGKKRVSRTRLSELVDETLAPGADVALFYFSGHALYRPGDVELAGQEAHCRGSGLSMADLLSRARESKIPDIVLILDCCYAGGAGGVPQLGNNVALIRSGITILSACRGDQRAGEKAGRGVFSSRLCAALEGGAADVLGNINVAGVYAYLSESFGVFDQRPTLLTSTSRSQELRRCGPTVSREELQELPRLFVHPDNELLLSPAYEPSKEPRDAEKESDFEILQKCRDNKLLVPIGEKHLYHAAVNSKSCGLTPLGRHYWAMAAGGRL